MPPPAPGEVTIGTRASGMNPADYKHFGPGQDHRLLPLTVGYEAAGVITAVGPGTSITTGGGAVGDEVIAFQILGGYSSALNVRASDVFVEAGDAGLRAGRDLLLAGTTAAELLATAGVDEGDTLLLHGAAGAVGLSVLQQARLIGARVIGTASKDNFGIVEASAQFPSAMATASNRACATPLRKASRQGWTPFGSDEAVDVSLVLLEDRRRFVTLTAFRRAGRKGLSRSERAIRPVARSGRRHGPTSLTWPPPGI